MDLEQLRDLSQPATLYVGDEVPGRCWPDARVVYDLWLTKRGHRVAPARQDISSQDLQSFLPQVSLFDVSLEPFSMRCRMMGTGFTRAVGFDATGHKVSEYQGTEMMIERAKWLATHVQPMLLLNAPMIWSAKDYKLFDALILPLIDGQGVCNMIFYFDYFHAN